ncbi:MAG: helix-turn-helix domain-containing protein [Bacteroidota bacterium]
MNNSSKVKIRVPVKRETVSNIVELAPLTRRLQHVAKKRGFKSYHEYNKHYLLQQGLPTQSEYRKQLAKKLGLKTETEYVNYLKSIRAQNPKYAELANLINTRLSELGINKSTLARLSGIPRNEISQYAKGCNYPKPKRLVKILEALQIYHHNPLIGDSHVLGKHVVLQKPKHPKYSELSNLITNALAKSGKNKTWLAKTTRIPISHISMYMNGRVYPSSARLERIKKVLDSLGKK